MGKAIAACMDQKKVPSRSFIVTNLPYFLRKWPQHPIFGPDHALSIELADHEAASLLPLYRNKRLIAVVGDAYGRMVDHPESAVELCQSLKEQL